MDPHVDVADAPANGARTLNGHPPRAGAMDPGVERRDTTPFVERTPVRSPFPPIADYAFLSDCHTGALVAPDGTVEWLCPPRFDAPSVFGAILDRSAGGFRLGPSAMGVPAGRRHEPGTTEAAARRVPHLLVPAGQRAPQRGGQAARAGTIAGRSA